MKTTGPWGIRVFRTFMALCVLGTTWLLWLTLREGNLAVAFMHGGIILICVSTVLLPGRVYLGPPFPSLSRRLDIPKMNQWLTFAGLGLLIISALLKATNDVPSN
ncbi:MAG: hypothetical protein ACRDGM_06080 [bacterium]